MWIKFYEMNIRINKSVQKKLTKVLVIFNNFNSKNYEKRNKKCVWSLG